MFRSYDHHQAENILIARVTQLTRDPLLMSVVEIMDTPLCAREGMLGFLQLSNFYIRWRVLMNAVMMIIIIIIIILKCWETIKWLHNW
jgi:hypothetical protein